MEGVWNNVRRGEALRRRSPVVRPRCDTAGTRCALEDDASPATARALVPLLYELLDAHGDTAQLAGDRVADLRWRAHLDYLRDLQRVTRETLAATAGGGSHGPR